jgi:hypothetical protein
LVGERLLLDSGCWILVAGDWLLVTEAVQLSTHDLSHKQPVTSNIDVDEANLMHW